MTRRALFGRGRPALPKGILGAAGAAALIVGSVQAAEVEDLDAIERDLAVAANVLEAALGSAADERFRVDNVEATYLARQGVLVSLVIANPTANRYIGWGADGWRWNWNDPRRTRDRSAPLDGIDQILRETLQFSIAPFAPEDLAELRALRQEQRELRDQQRQLRRRLRGLRGQAARAEGDRRSELEAEIAADERELNALEDDYAALEMDIDAEYERLRTQRDQPDAEPPASDATASGLDTLIVEAVCDYGATLNSLPDDAHLTIAARFVERPKRRFYVFAMPDVVACQRNAIDVAALRERAYVYDL